MCVCVKSNSTFYSNPTIKTSCKYELDYINARLYEYEDVLYKLLTEYYLSWDS